MRPGSVSLILCGAAAGVVTGFALGEWAASRWRFQQRHRGGEARHTGHPVRSAGPRHMEDPPRDWDMVDEEADESFPASDPPANY